MDIRHIEEKTKELKAQSLPLVQAVEKTQALVNELSTRLENMKVDKQQEDIDATLAQMAKERDARVLLDELTEHLTKQKEALHQFWNNEETNYSIRAEANRSQEYLSPTESQLIEGLIDNSLKRKLKAYGKEVEEARNKAIEIVNYLKENNYDQSVGNALHPLVEAKNFYYFRMAQLISSTFQHELMEYLLEDGLITNYPGYYTPRR
ncbi:hypothetical protein KB529_08890 [Lactococcus lactis subsp. lactis]|uniref:Prophage ps2 protein 18 n=1 Tax=Lactococcus cremoris subsp. tructae TaxID=542833 RepID=A0A2A5SY88_LACLC|nr:MULTISPECIES: hypothetical protein [Lactococcus]MBS3730654.1 hypothetical protein [Lactococcus lactis subsp. lactis]MCU5753530.1 hypothetical protein [Lactococcus lactis]PCS20884.1 prophage ps2 protein 18 [Lactococcus cremoris subsp. tructae]